MATKTAKPTARSKTSRAKQTKPLTKTLLTVKVDKKLKAQAQKTAEQIGLPLGTVLNGFLRQFVMDKRITFEVPLIPTPYLEKILAEAEKEIENGDVSPAFSNAEDAIAYLHSLR